MGPVFLWGEMLSLTALGLEASSVLGGSSIDLIRGVIAGAVVVGAAFLAGFAVLRRGSAAACALVMVVAAGALEFAALGFFPSLPPAIVVLLQGVFAAAALIFLSSAIRSARNNAILGGVMFAAALSLIGLGVLNIVLQADLSGLMRSGLFGVGAFAILLSAYEAFRGDAGAQLILPGALIAVVGPIAAMTMSGGSLTLAPHGLFIFGVLTASLVSLAEGLTPRVTGWPLETHPVDSTNGAVSHSAPTQSELLRVSENQLAQVLDYSGVAVWDWTHNDAHQTNSFGQLMGADGDGVFTPEALRSFVHKNDLGKFDASVFGKIDSDGGFDQSVKLHNGNQVRMRGARAIDANGELERLVVFLEPVNHRKNGGGSSEKKTLAASTVASAASAGAGLKSDAAEKNDAGKKDAKLADVDGPIVERRKDPETDRRKPRASLPELAAQVTTALKKKKLEAAFQPIVDLKSERVVGYEALIRWPEGAEEAPNAGPEDIVRAAQAAGLGHDLARMMLTSAAAFLAKTLKGKKQDQVFAALNVSVGQIMESGFVDDVKKAISSNKLPAGALVLELTEAEQINDVSKATAVFEKLRKAGAALAFDDFGAGFSSLSNLQKFTFDYLKIDKSFIGELTSAAAEDDGGAAKIVASVAGLGKDLGMKVIAEGIESREAAETALSMGCHFGQGFLFGGPELEGAEGKKRQSSKEPAQEKPNSIAALRSRNSDVDDTPERKRGWKSIWSKGGLR